MISSIKCTCTCTKNKNLGDEGWIKSCIIDTCTWSGGRHIKYMYIHNKHVHTCHIHTAHTHIVYTCTHTHTYMYMYYHVYAHKMVHVALLLGSLWKYVLSAYIHYKQWEDVLAVAKDIEIIRWAPTYMYHVHTLCTCNVHTDYVLVQYMYVYVSNLKGLFTFILGRWFRPDTIFMPLPTTFGGSQAGNHGAREHSTISLLCGLIPMR